MKRGKSLLQKKLKQADLLNVCLVISQMIHDLLLVDFCGSYFIAQYDFFLIFFNHL